MRISARRIRQSTINVWAAILLSFMFAFLVLGSWALRSGTMSSAAAAAKESAAHLLGDDVNRISDYLTDQVRTFAVTQDRASLDA